ncbi:ABC transporter permease [Streptomyces fildesensis]|uniref:ABC transporter permease n=1 Tax=Streptomyces fildesensis TaxID=375757 RepID=A0ABW8CBZ2_9ACTN
MRAITRWALADLRTHRGQALSIVLATAGITVALLLSAALLQYAVSPWQRLFTETQGGHVWLRTAAGTPTGQLSRLDGVQALSGPFRTDSVTVRLGAETAALDLRAAGPHREDVAQPKIAAGRWLDGTQGDGIVLEQSVASALWAQPGDTLQIETGGTAIRTLRVVGTARTAERGYVRGDVPGVGWAAPDVVGALASAQTHPGQTVGLRLADPGDTDFVVQRAVAAVGPDHVLSVSTWRDARSAAEGDNRLLGLLLRIFGLGALLAAAVAVTGGVSTRVLAHVRDISVLKAVGFTPGQIAGMFFAQHAVLAVLGAAVGTAAVQIAGAAVPGPIGEAVTLWQALPGQSSSLLYTCAATVSAIAAATMFAAWRAARIPPIPAARTTAPGGRRSAHRGRTAFRFRTPPSLVLGWRGAVHRPRRFAASVARLALPIVMITVALSAAATLDRFQHPPERAGLTAQLTAREDGASTTGLESRLARLPGVSGVYPATEVAALVPGQTRTITLRGLGTAGHRYPFAAAEGRAATAPDEAMAGQGLLDAMDVRVGEWVRVTVAGTPHILHIVGRSIETEHNGMVISTSLDTLQEGQNTLRPQFYHLALRPGADPAAVSRALPQASDGRLEIRTTAGPADELSPIRGVIAGLVAVLALIGLVDLSTSITAAVRDHSRDLRALRAIGLTPRQTVAVIQISAAVIALAAALAGTVVGVLTAHWLIDLQGRSSGIGAGIAQTPALTTLLLAGGAVVTAAVTIATLPALRVVRGRGADPGITIY